MFRTNSYLKKSPIKLVRKNSSSSSRESTHKKRQAYKGQRTKKKKLIRRKQPSAINLHQLVVKASTIPFSSWVCVLIIIALLAFCIHHESRISRLEKILIRM